MTDKKSRRVVIINNIKSDNIDQAIFILKNNRAEGHHRIKTTIVQEAQDIINSYVRQVDMIRAESPNRRKKQRALRFTATLSVLSVICIGLSVALLLIMR
ncbi:MAG: hypothetical protein E7401_00795 [Ruminococcaceae bacterium]|nr:hypothetical protein [Oscillospiraceae bacterium]